MWVDVDRRVRLGRLLGLATVAAGFIVIGKAWDGAASKNFITGQFPYLISGGFLGLGLIVTGTTLMRLATERAERQVLTAKFDEMALLLGRNLARLGISSNGTGPEDAAQVVAGATVYHRPECKILQGKRALTRLTLEQAAAEGLAPCRVCNPPAPAADKEDAGVEAASSTA